MTAPLTDAELAEFAEHLAERKRRDPDCLYDDWRVVERLLADAHHHRAALAEAREKNEIMLVNFESVAKHQANTITEARAENERLRATMNEAIGWCQAERSKLSGDGYDYASGEEYGLRRAQIELERRAALAPKEPKP